MNWLIELIQNAAYNKALYQSGLADKSEVRFTTIGWRPDPVNEADGYTEDPKAPSGNVEYFRKEK